MEREAAACDEQALLDTKHKEVREQGAAQPCGRPGTQSKAIAHPACEAQQTASVPTPQSRLSRWPVQIKLATVNAPCFNGARLPIAADCTAAKTALQNSGKFIPRQVLTISADKNILD